MDLRDALLELVAPARIGDVLGGARLVRVSSELGLRLTFEDGDALVHVEVFPDAPDRPAAARSERLAFAYRRTSSSNGRAICLAVADRARDNERRVLDALAEGDGATDRVREITGGELLQPVERDGARYLTLSPYVGCLIGCRFCYAQERLAITRAFAGRPDVPWGSYVDARIDAPERLEEELPRHPNVAVKLCPIVSDPYQAIEARLRLTRRCLETIRDVGGARAVFVLTRARLIERDADVLSAIDGARVGFSIPTIDDDVRASFEPRAAAIPERLEVLRRFRADGVRTFAVVQPPLPGDPTALADALAEAVSSVSLDVLQGEQGAAPLFDRYPEARDPAWQRDRVAQLRALLEARGVEVWRGELPA